MVEELEPGTRFREGTVVVVEVEGDRGLAGDMRTARVLVDMANSTYSYLQFTADCPSLHPTGWMPLLDLEIRIAEDMTVDYKFYSKPCSSKYVMIRNSAMPARTKMSSVTQEAVRRLRNTWTTLPWKDYQAPILTDFARKLARSGYNEAYREAVIKSGVAGFEKQVEARRMSIKPLFRPRAWNKEERRKKKMVKEAAWHKPADCVGFFPPTPGGGLAKEIGNDLKKEGEKIGMALRSIESGGVSLTKLLVSTDMKTGDLIVS